MDVGILGGTFDPIHAGHLAIAEEAMRSLKLSDVVFVPAGEPWLKEDRDITPGEQRLEMIYMAIASNPSFHVSTVDLDREGPSYTVDTLGDLRHNLGEGADMYFIVGMDALAGLPTWKEPERVVEMCHLVGAKRPGAADVDIDELERRVPGISKKLVILDNRKVDISSSDIRQRVAAGLPIDSMVPEAVARYIQEQGLYRKED